MKKILLMLLVLLGLSMSACSLGNFFDKNEPEHKHSIVEGWKNDSTNHWQICDSCDEKVNFGAHEFSEWEKVEGLDLEIRSCACGWEEQRSTTPVAQDLTVYYYNTLGWETINAYVWDGEGAELNGSWPGSAMVAESDNWYTVTVSATSLEGLSIIFNNGSAQTVDIALNNSDIYYYGNNGIGFDSKEAAIEAYEAEQAEPVVPNVYYLRGSMNDWGTSAPLTVNGDVASIEIEILRTDEFKVACESWDDKNFGITDGVVTVNGGNFKVEKSGLYRVSVINYGTEEETVTIELLEEYQDQVVKNDYYFRGTINSVNNWNTCDETVKFVAGETSATLEVTLAVGDEFKVAVAGDGWSPQYNASNTTYEADHIGGTDNLVVKTAGKYKLEITGWGTVEEKLVITLVEAVETPVEKVYEVEINGVKHTLAPNPEKAGEYQVLDVVVVAGQVLKVLVDGEEATAIADAYQGNNLNTEMTIVNNATASIYVKPDNAGWSVWVTGYVAPEVPDPVENVYTIEINGVSYTLVKDEDATLDTNQTAEYTVTVDSVEKDQTVVVKLNGAAIINIGAHGDEQNVTGNGGEGMSIVNDATNVTVAFKLWQDGGHSLAVSGYVAPVVPEEKEVTVYYYNTEKWAQVYAYSWDSADNKLLGTWPGSAMTAETEGWYTITIEAASLEGLSIIFNNNSIAQTPDISLDAKNPYYYGINTIGFASKEAALEAYAAEQVSPNVYYLRGDMNDWNTSKPLTVNGDVASIEIHISKGQGFKVACASWDDKWFGDANGQNLTVEVSGLYLVSVINYGSDNEELKIELVKEDEDQTPIEVVYYIVGGFNGWAAADADYMMVADSENAGFYVIKNVELTANQTLKVIEVSEGTIWNGYTNFKGDTNLNVSRDNDDNIVLADAGTYNISFKPEGREIYITKVDTTDGEEPEAPVVPETKMITIYFLNNWLWTDVCAYYWGDNEQATWPGVAMEKVDEFDGYELYAIELDMNKYPNFIINGIKNDGSGGRDQTPDLKIADYEQVASYHCLYMVYDNGNGVEHREFQHSFGDELKYDDLSHYYTCVGCGEVKEKIPHNYVDGTCIDCGSEDPDYSE